MASSFYERSQQIDNWLASKEMSLRDRLYLLSLPDVSTDTLRRFSKRKGLGISSILYTRAVARHLSTPTDVLKEMLKDGATRFLFSPLLFSNPNFPFGEIEPKNRRQKIALARNPNLGMEEYKKLTNGLNARRRYRKRLYLPSSTKRILPRGIPAYKGEASRYEIFSYLHDFNAFGYQKNGDKALMDLFKSPFVTRADVESIGYWGDLPNVSIYSFNSWMLKRKYRKLARFYTEREKN